MRVVERDSLDSALGTAAGAVPISNTKPVGIDRVGVVMAGTDSVVGMAGGVVAIRDVCALTVTADLLPFRKDSGTRDSRSEELHEVIILFGARVDERN